MNVAPKGDFYDEIHHKFYYFLNKYNILSSFVHGGPSAEHETFHILPPPNKAKKINESIEWTKTVSRMIKFQILTLLLDDTKDSYLFYKKIIESLMDNLQKN